MNAGDSLSVAIDGPSGVGKTTAARRLAARLGIPYLDTGAMYRAVALKAVRCGVDLGDEAALAQMLEETALELTLISGGGAEIILDGNAVDEGIRTPEVGEAASRVAAVSAVRRHLVGIQQRFAKAYGGVLEGRDIGTVVLPEASFKFFLDAGQSVRARRRLLEIQKRDPAATEKSVADELARRDLRDSTRADSPLRMTDSYHRLDTSELTAEEVAERMVRIVRATTV